MTARLILHADDFGLNRAVTAGIVRGFDRGLLTSTALIANAPDAEGAIGAWKELARRHPQADTEAPLRESLDGSAPFDLGIHLNLTQGRPLTASAFPDELLDQQGRFLNVFRLFARLQRRRDAYRAALDAELSAQIRLMLDHGLRPTHLNGHQYIEMLPQVARCVLDLLRRFQIAVVRVAVEPGLFNTALWYDGRPHAWALGLVKRHFARRFRDHLAQAAVIYPARYFGTAHAGRIDLSLVNRFLTQAPRKGVIEIGLHPALSNRANDGASDDDGWLDPLADLRPRELALVESAELAGLLKARDCKLARLSQLKAA